MDITFPTTYSQIIARMQNFDPAGYASTRNFADGKVSYLSPYISRGVISTRQIMSEILSGNHPRQDVEKFIQELAWRDYWQEIWKSEGSAIDRDLKKLQTDAATLQMPEAILNAKTGITAVDEAIRKLVNIGYMHNHMRMYVASITCNFGQAHWHLPAQWLYYHLLDGDWASNALSWQWVAGTNAQKKYIFNQNNLNKYWHSDQHDTFLDADYDGLPPSTVPDVLRKTTLPELKTALPRTNFPLIDPDKPTCLYTYYNLDPAWRTQEDHNRILILEPSVFDRYPVSARCLDFALKLAQNIPRLQVYTGEAGSLAASLPSESTFYREHPLNRHFPGREDPRPTMFKVRGYYPSFFAFWKKCKTEIDW